MRMDREELALERNKHHPGKGQEEKRRTCRGGQGTISHIHKHAKEKKEKRNNRARSEIFERERAQRIVRQRGRKGKFDQRFSLVFFFLHTCSIDFQRCRLFSCFFLSPFSFSPLREYILMVSFTHTHTHTHRTTVLPSSTTADPFIYHNITMCAPLIRTTRTRRQRGRNSDISVSFLFFVCAALRCCFRWTGREL